MLQAIDWLNKIRIIKRWWRSHISIICNIVLILDLNLSLQISNNSLNKT